VISNSFQHGLVAIRCFNKNLRLFFLRANVVQADASDSLAALNRLANNLEMQSSAHSIRWPLVPVILMRGQPEVSLVCFFDAPVDLTQRPDQLPQAPRLLKLIPHFAQRAKVPVVPAAQPLRFCSLVHGSRFPVMVFPMDAWSEPCLNCPPRT